MNKQAHCCHGTWERYLGKYVLASVRDTKWLEQPVAFIQKSIVQTRISLETLVRSARKICPTFFFSFLFFFFCWDLLISWENPRTCSLRTRTGTPFFILKKSYAQVNLPQWWPWAETYAALWTPALSKSILESAGTVGAGQRNKKRNDNKAIQAETSDR